MSEHTDPIWSLILFMLIAGFLLALLTVAACNGLVALLTWIDRRDRKRLAVEAADHGEPTREAVERLVDGEEWARRNGYEDDCWWPFNDEDPAMPPSLALYIAEHATDDIDEEWRRICDATGGAA